MIFQSARCETTGILIFLPAKLEQLARYEVTIEEDVKHLCMRLLDAMKARKVEAEQ
jgi:hypothetical protein